jgi:hypothetical protein
MKRLPVLQTVRSAPQAIPRAIQEVTRDNRDGSPWYARVLRITHWRIVSQAVFFGLFCGELVVALTLLFTMLLTWPKVPWDGILYGVTAGSILALPISLPFAKVVWLNVDSLVRPIQPDELT